LCACSNDRAFALAGIPGGAILPIYDALVASRR
jgi:thiamine pyrophosphate-dependent acetolactate synthase large subunit-like protein